MGVDICVDEQPLQMPPQPSRSAGRPAPRQATPAAARVVASPANDKPPPAAPASERVLSARQIAAGAPDLVALRQAVEQFDGCPLKATATRLCFADGNPGAQVMMIGEAPGLEEDRQGKPFVGASGQLLDRMLARIGLDRQQVYITNTVFWRPPGNRTPTTVEVAICQPFLERQIELIGPKLLMLVGASAASVLLGRQEGVTKLRGRWLEYQPSFAGPPIPALVTFHPAYLLRQPLQKKLVWRDLLSLRTELGPLGLDANVGNDGGAAAD